MKQKLRFLETITSLFSYDKPPLNMRVTEQEKKKMHMTERDSGSKKWLER